MFNDEQRATIFVSVIYSISFAFISSVLFFNGISRNLETADSIALLAASIAFLGVVAALLQGAIAWRAKTEQRERFTFKYLTESRFTEYFRTLREARALSYPPYSTIDFRQWKADFISSSPDNRASAEAVVELLNWHEFMASQIRAGVLHEPTLKKTLRGITASFVHDARNVIAGLRATSPATYKDLAWLYGRWRRDGEYDLNGNRTELLIP